MNISEGQSRVYTIFSSLYPALSFEMRKRQVFEQKLVKMHGVASQKCGPGVVRAWQRENLPGAEAVLGWACRTTLDMGTAW